MSDMKQDPLRYARELAISIWEKHWKETAPHWKPMETLTGLLSQIDNMTCTLSQRDPKPVAAGHFIMSSGGEWRQVDKTYADKATILYHAKGWPCTQPEATAPAIIHADQLIGLPVSMDVSTGEEAYMDAYDTLLNHINAALAQVAQDKTDYANEMIEACRKLRDRAAAAEAKVAAYEKALNPRLWDSDMDRVWHQSIPDVYKAFGELRASALALLQPQAQPDTSGLPG